MTEFGISPYQSDLTDYTALATVANAIFEQISSPFLFMTPFLALHMFNKTESVIIPITFQHQWKHWVYQNNIYSLYSSTAYTAPHPIQTYT